MIFYNYLFYNNSKNRLFAATVPAGHNFMVNDAADLLRKLP